MSLNHTCSGCQERVELHWLFCRSCGRELEWYHRSVPDEDALCNCGNRYCHRLIERLSARLANRLKITQEEGANLQ
jgi:hypothetical protein